MFELSSLEAELSLLGLKLSSLEAELSSLADSNAKCRPAMVEPGGVIQSAE
ncbi:hypothetical protein [Bhargavaea cecembensis]|uniref:hypothetical protein n=1 Tax=Bhargavaea cecembensis TaxID=394098 RepID=UPI0015CF0952|nr:hypothetical protein [Bhargavaea cecembensis]